MKDNYASNKFHWVYLVGFFLILALPLLNIPPWLSPPAWSKAIVFRSLLAILFCVFIVTGKTLRDPKGTPSGQVSFQKISAPAGPALGWKTWLNPKSPLFVPLVALLAFLITVFVSTLTSLDVSFSLWGDPNRGAGFINFFFLVLFCLFGFSIIKKENPPMSAASWRKLLDFSLIIGFLVGLIAIFQQFGILNNIFVHMDSRPSSTLGSTIFLSLYLLPLLFLAISFFLLEKDKIKKYFYLFLTIFYAFSIVFITQSRAAFLGILVGLFWFLIAYPARNLNAKKISIIKICAVAFLAIILISFFILGNNPKILEKWNPALKNPILRMTSLAQGLGADPVRISVWKVSMQAFLEKPLFGYGPENFYIAFNKHYDPNLPMEGLKDFDRAHNSLIEILIDSGIFALIFYLIFFFSLLWGLQKIKKNYPVAHGLQAGFLAYFVASLASIDSFSTFLIFFFFSAYSLYLISLNNADSTLGPKGYPTLKNAEHASRWPLRLKIPALWFLGLCLIIFIWQYNLVPLQMNKQINVAQQLATESWQNSFNILEEQSKTKTFFLPYVNSTYLKLLVDRIASHPEETNTLSEKIAKIAKTNTELQPYGAQNWLRLGESLSMLAQTKEANDAFVRAQELSPKNLTILLASFMADITAKDYKSAQGKSAYCLKTFPEIKECLWMSGLISVYLNNIETGKNFIKKAAEKRYPVENEASLSQLSVAYLENKHYEEMLPIYQKLVTLNDSQVQYKTSLMLTYKLLGQYDKARQLALEVIKTNPELKPTLENFLQSF